MTDRSSPRRARAWVSTGILSATLISGLAGGAAGCGGSLVRLAKQEQWQAVDDLARAQKRAPRGKAARAWAQALVELGEVEEARSVLLTDFRHGGHDASLLALAELERERGLVGVAAAHYARLATINPDTVSRSDQAEAACELLRARAMAEATLGEAVVADTDMRRVALLCPTTIDDEDRAFLSSLRPISQQQVEAQHSLAAGSLEGEGEGAGAGGRGRERDDTVRAQLELARKRGPRAVATVADAEGIQVEPDDFAVLLAAEFGGALGAALVSHSRLSAWAGDNPVDALSAAIDTLPKGVREYALLRLASVREHPDADTMTQTWIVAAGAALVGQGPHEAAKAWRISASVGELSAAEFALNTNLRDMIPPVLDAPGAEADGAGAGTGIGTGSGLGGPHWSQRVPVDRRSFDLLLTLARLLEHRKHDVLALELRRSVLVAGYEVGLAQVAEAAVEEVRRQLILGHPWQALAIAEVVPGPLLGEALPALASAVALARAAGLDEALDHDQNIVWRSLGDAWVEQWGPRLDGGHGGLDLGDDERCPDIGRWLDPDAAESLRAVGLDPERSRRALELAFAELGAAETGAALAEALESDLALACSAPLISLLGAGLHELRLATLDERLIHAPELSSSLSLQLHAELALAHGEARRATGLTLSAAGLAVDPRALWARAARAGLSQLDHGAREYTIEALRQVLLHTPGLDDPAARRELLVMRLRDVDGDEDLRSGRASAIDELRGQVDRYLDEAAASQRWSRVEALLWQLAGEPRADARAWSLLLDVLDLPSLATAHPEASAAVLAAARAGGAELDQMFSPGASLARSTPAILSDTRALCETAGQAAAEAPIRLVGAALACSARERAEAHAELLAWVGEDEGPKRAALRSAILSGPIAFEPEAERPAVVHGVPALISGELIARIVFGLPLEPVWAVRVSP